MKIYFLVVIGSLLSLAFDAGRIRKSRDIEELKGSDIGFSPVRSGKMPIEPVDARGGRGGRGGGGGRGRGRGGGRGRSGGRGRGGGRGGGRGRGRGLGFRGRVDLPNCDNSISYRLRYCDPDYMAL